MSSFGSLLFFFFWDSEGHGVNGGKTILLSPSNTFPHPAQPNSISLFHAGIIYFSLIQKKRIDIWNNVAILNLDKYRYVNRQVEKCLLLTPFHGSWIWLPSIYFETLFQVSLGVWQSRHLKVSFLFFFFSFFCPFRQDLLFFTCSIVSKGSFQSSVELFKH